MNLVFHGRFQIEEIRTETKTKPFNKMQVGDIFTVSIPAFGSYLRSGKSYAVDTKIEYEDETYTVSGGFVVSAVNSFKLRQLLVV